MSTSIIKLSTPLILLKTEKPIIDNLIVSSNILQIKQKNNNSKTNNISPTISQNNYEEFKNKETLIDPRYKTELCKSFINFSKCKYGYRCRFAHGLNDLISKKRKVKSSAECQAFVIVGFCKYGEKCELTHPEMQESDRKFSLEENAINKEVRELLYKTVNKNTNNECYNSNSTNDHEYCSTNTNSNCNSNYNTSNLCNKKIIVDKKINLLVNEINEDDYISSISLSPINNLDLKTLCNYKPKNNSRLDVFKEITKKVDFSSNNISLIKEKTNSSSNSLLNLSN